MTRFCLTLGLLVCAASVAGAQPVPPGGGAAQRPAFSPYLNLLNGSGNPGFNYLGIIRPQQRLQDGINQNQQQLKQNTGLFQQELNGLALGADPNLPFTGQVARFNSVAPYFTRNPVTGQTGRIRTGFGGNGLAGGGGFNSLAGNFGGLNGGARSLSPAGGSGRGGVGGASRGVGGASRGVGGASRGVGGARR